MKDEEKLKYQPTSLEARRRAKEAQDTQAVLEGAMAATMALVADGYRAAQRQHENGAFPASQIHMYALVHCLTAQYLANKDLLRRIDELTAKLEEQKPKVTL